MTTLYARFAFVLIVAFALCARPAQAGPVKRSTLRVVKWGVGVPLQVVGCLHALPGIVIYGAGKLIANAANDELIEDALVSPAVRPGKVLPERPYGIMLPEPEADEPPPITQTFSYPVNQLDSMPAEVELRPALTVLSPAN